MTDKSEERQATAGDDGGGVDEAGLRLDALTQTDRDALRGWNDVPLGMTTGNTERPSGASRTKHRYVTATAQHIEATKAPASAVDPTLFPPTSSSGTTPKTHFVPGHSVASQAGAVADKDKPRVDLAPYKDRTAQDVHGRLKALVEAAQNQGKAKVAKDIDRRLTPLMDKLAAGSLTNNAVILLAALTEAISRGDKGAAQQLQVDLVMQCSEQIGNSAVALKKLISVASGLTV